MRTMVLGLVVALGIGAWGTTPELLSATFLGSKGVDDLQGVTFAPDGTIYVVGNMDEIVDLPGLPAAPTLGDAIGDTWYKCGFVAQFSADGKKALRCAQFSGGQVFLTSVAATKDGVYVGGYAMPEASALFAGLGGMFPTAEAANKEGVPWPKDGEARKAGFPAVNPMDKAKRLSLISQHHGDKGGVPCVMRFDRELKRIEAGTYLEGYHYAWNINQQLDEDEWTPTAVRIMEDRRVVVGHDGGVPGHYYYAPDYVSKLDPSLKRREWRFDVYLPETRVEKVLQHQVGKGVEGWKYPVFGQTRLLAVKTDGRNAIYICGWSVSATSNEPWWVPFLWKLDGDGKVVWKAYSHDPMSGVGDRVNGEVADSVIRNVAAIPGGDVWVAGLADGGNSVTRLDPRDYSKPVTVKMIGEFGKGSGGGERYKGIAIRLSDDLQVKAIERLGRGVPGVGGVKPGWIVDMAGLPGDRGLFFGRHNWPYPRTADAWSEDTLTTGGFVRVVGADLKEQFLSNLPNVSAYELATRGTRAAFVGVARSATALTKEAVQAASAGDYDGYLLVADFPE